MRTYLLAGFLLTVVGAMPTAAQERVLPLDTLTVSVASDASAAVGATTRAVEVITRDEIAAMPARDIKEVLRWAFGADLMPRSPALADVALRGSSFEQVLVLVNGVRVSDSQTGHFDLSLTVPLQQVERIEILRGAASSLHGSDALGGVINIVTRGEGGAMARVDGGSFGNAGIAAARTIRMGRLTTDAAIDLRRSDGFRDGTDFQLGTGRLALTTPLLGRQLHADIAFAARDFGAFDFYGPYPSYEETRTTTASLAWRGDAGERLSIEPVLTYRRNDDDFTLRRADPAYYRNQHRTDQWNGEVNARYAYSDLVSIAGGVHGEFDRLRSQSLGDRSEGRAGVSSEVAVGNVGEAIATVGLRADWRETEGLFWSPSLAAAWWPTAAVRLRGSVGRALRTPTWTERYYRDPANIGDPNLHAEDAWSGELGLDAMPIRALRVGVAAFLRDSHDLIDWARPVGSDGATPWHTRNVNDARFRGIEAEAELPDILGIRLAAEATWLSVTATAEDDFESKYALRPLVETYALTVERRLFDGASIALRGQRARRQAQPSEVYTRFDSRFSYGFGEFRTFVDVQNLADEAYTDVTGSLAPGRGVSVGLEWRGGAD